MSQTSCFWMDSTAARRTGGPILTPHEKIPAHKLKPELPITRMSADASEIRATNVADGVESM